MSTFTWLGESGSGILHGPGEFASRRRAKLDGRDSAKSDVRVKGADRAKKRTEDATRPAVLLFVAGFIADVVPAGLR